MGGNGASWGVWRPAAPRAKYPANGTDPLTEDEKRSLNTEFTAYRNESMFLFENPDLFTAEQLGRYFDRFKERTTNIEDLKKGGLPPAMFFNGQPVLEYITKSYIIGWRVDDAAAAKPKDPNAKPALIYVDNTGKVVEGFPGYDFGRKSTIDFSK